MTAASAVDGICEVDSTGGIGLLSSESDAPYDRPPLSKKLWKGKPLCTISRKTKGKKVSGLETRCNQLVLKMSGNREIVADGVVAGVGIAPNVELAQATKRRKVSSTACKTVACAACCCGTSGSTWVPRELIAEPGRFQPEDLKGPPK